MMVSAAKVRLDMRIYRANQDRWYDLPPVGAVPWRERLYWWFRVHVLGYRP